jgi:hypothetical protein
MIDDPRLQQFAMSSNQRIRFQAWPERIFWITKPASVSFGQHSVARNLKRLRVQSQPCVSVRASRSPMHPSFLRTSQPDIPPSSHTTYQTEKQRMNFEPDPSEPKDFSSAFFSLESIQPESEAVLQTFQQLPSSQTFQNSSRKK